jgi:choline dehydrogenase
VEYDYIIAGAGSAGCILASRLSESGQHSVLLLEAGGKDSSFWFKIPVGFAKTYYSEKYNWMYYSEPEKELGDRAIYCPRGKVQGGSGSINAMIFLRGPASDYDDWAAAGNPGWSYRDVLPHFRKLETHPRGDTEYHGNSGPIHITPMKDGAHPICQAFLAGCRELGYPINDDFNGATVEGAGIYDINTRNGQRCSSSFAHLHPALSRSNLTVERYAVVDKVLIGADKRVTGVQVTQGGVAKVFTARREVILAAGAVDTPKILQLSGVADGALLARHGLETLHHLPAVGQNLQDHLCVSFYYKANVKTLNDDFSSLVRQAQLGLQYLLLRTGPFSLSVNQAGGFFRGSPDEPRANIQIYFNPLSYRIPKSNKASLVPEPYSGFLIAFNPTRPTSRGTIEIASAKVQDAARIMPNYLSTQKDLDEVIQGNRLVRHLATAPALRQITIEEVSPGPGISSDAEALQYFREQSGSIYHLCGSCAMGPDPASSVVDSRLKVHGLAGLRVVDASIFPAVTTGNTNAGTMMVAEKGAAMILEDA